MVNHLYLKKGTDEYEKLAYSLLDLLNERKADVRLGINEFNFIFENLRVCGKAQAAHKLFQELKIKSSEFFP